MRPVPPEALVLGGIGSVQFGTAFGNKLFDEAGPAGVVLLRVALAAIILLAFVRPSLRGRSRADLLAAGAFGVVLGCMNWSFYEAIDRLPIGVAVTIEFTGPLAVAVAGSRRALDLVWVTLAGGGVVLLTLRGGQHGVHTAGVLLALVAAVCWAAYILLSQRVGAAFAQLDGLAVA
ncbi:MAG: inner rane transporter RhtA, partial [Actinomycetota bacterium]|nr:inner rane transporter RhtA [Actinomycetota bacterium]